MVDNTDCLDSDDTVYVDADEICDGLDNDCDGLTDDNDPDIDVSTYNTWYVDADDDGFGDPTLTAEACLLSDGYASNPFDCDDADDAIFLGALETCGDGIDQDCNGVDLLCAGDDSDGDGFCDAATCTDGTTPGDCDDGDPDINPFGVEVCNAVDDNCDGYIDENLTFDEDNDGQFTEFLRRSATTISSRASIQAHPSSATESTRTVTASSMKGSSSMRMRTALYPKTPAVTF